MVPGHRLPGPLALLVGLAACDSPLAADRFQASDFFGEWRVQVPATSCWAALDIAFAITPATLERDAQGSMSFSSRWGEPADSARERLVQGYLHWRGSTGGHTFQLAFFRSGVILGELVGSGEQLSADRLDGIFFDPNRQSCRTAAAARKVGP